MPKQTLVVFKGERLFLPESAFAHVERATKNKASFIYLNSTDGGLRPFDKIAIAVKEISYYGLVEMMPDPALNPPANDSDGDLPPAYPALPSGDGSPSSDAGPDVEASIASESTGPRLI